MYLIQQITNNPLQNQNIVLPNGNTVALTLYFRPMQFGWFINQLVYGTTFVLNGIRITNNPNILYQWRKLIPFGLACFSTNNREPSQQQDFSSGASQLYILGPDEVLEYTGFLEGG